MVKVVSLVVLALVLVAMPFLVLKVAGCVLFLLAVPSLDRRVLAWWDGRRRTP